MSHIEEERTESPSDHEGRRDAAPIEETNVEEALDKLLTAMEQALLGSKSGKRTLFWQTKQQALDLFQHHVSTGKRVRLWERYTKLCQEARALQETFEEESAFVGEQIEKALCGLDEELGSLPEKVQNFPVLDEIASCRAVRENSAIYSSLQQELHYLNNFVERLLSLKREVLQAQIRLKNKQALLQHLTKTADLLFPRRKERIQQISSMFQKDVEEFIAAAFVGDMTLAELFEVREEIKKLQHVAKICTLHIDAFLTTRDQLSKCWDAIKETIQRKKQAQTEHKHAMRQHREELLGQLKELDIFIEQPGFDLVKARSELRAIQSKMRSLTLFHNDVIALKKEMKKIEERLYDMHDEVVKKRDVVEVPREEARKKLLNEKASLELQLEAVGRLQASSSGGIAFAFEMNDKKQRLTKRLKEIQRALEGL